MKKSNLRTALLPIIIITIGFLVAVIANYIIQEWAFIPLSIIYWTAIFIITKPTRQKLKEIFLYPTKNLKYIFVAFIPVLFCIVSFVWGIQYINGIILIVLWILFAIINPIAEELFWRGYLFDNLDWKPFLKIVFSSVLFLLSHFLMWGVFSITIRSYIMIMPLLIMGLTWGYVYHKTGNLKWCIISHFFVDIMNLSVWVFLNIYIPPVIK